MKNAQNTNIKNELLFEFINEIHSIQVHNNNIPTYISTPYFLRPSLLNFLIVKDSLHSFIGLYHIQKIDELPKTCDFLFSYENVESLLKANRHLYPKYIDDRVNGRFKYDDICVYAITQVNDDKHFFLNLSKLLLNTDELQLFSYLVHTFVSPNQNYVLFKSTTSTDKINIKYNGIEYGFGRPLAIFNLVINNKVVKNYYLNLDMLKAVLDEYYVANIRLIQRLHTDILQELNEWVKKGVHVKLTDLQRDPVVDFGYTYFTIHLLTYYQAFYGDEYCDVSYSEFLRFEEFVTPTIQQIFKSKNIEIAPYFEQEDIRKCCNNDGYFNYVRISFNPLEIESLKFYL